MVAFFSISAEYCSTTLGAIAYGLRFECAQSNYRWRHGTGVKI